MIINFRHKGLELYARKGDRSKLPQQHILKIKMILTRLDAAESPDQMNQPGYKYHQLTGALKRFYSVSVSGNYRIIFRFENGNAFDIDYLDYH
jgi:proteic killer suppression protein